MRPVIQRLWPHALFVLLAGILFVTITLVSGDIARTNISDGDPDGIFGFPWPLGEGLVADMLLAAPFLLLGRSSNDVLHQPR